MINGRCLGHIYLLIILVLGLTFGFGLCIAFYVNFSIKRLIIPKKLQVLILNLFL
jgi:hypothetical protein